ncbi:glycosyltransferase [Candidatus Hecatella orcuttiae]|jgi:glycosyltransferase involved in cell wall biosynthesis|uniref:glycosyltransferase n=1 Tax=Candidatus Hecatella orcuttiae TaxID=1935119 RepID=UPI002867CAED|nr:glycosyltransferase [Candidatus Hecatella orcuttiae]
MKIAYISTYPPTSCGIAEYTRNLAEATSRLTGVNVTVLSDNFGNSAARIDELGILVIPSFSPSKLSYGSLLKVASEHGPFDVIHVQHEYGLFRPTVRTLEAFKGLKKHCRRLTVTMHTVVSSFRKRIAEHQERLCRTSDTVIVHNTAQEYELLSQGVDPAKVQKIPHGTCIIGFSRIDKGETLKKLNLSSLNGKFLFVCPGFIRRDKGQNTLIKAFSRVHEKLPNTACIIAGIPPRVNGAELVANVESSLTADGVNGMITMKKYLTNDELDLILKAADVVVFPYKDQRGIWSVSGAFHKAVGCFKPVICSRVPRLAECSMMAPDITVPKNDVNALAEKMMTAATHYEGFLKKCRPLMELALSTSWQKIAKMHLNLYQQALTKHERLTAKTMKITF